MKPFLGVVADLTSERIQMNLYYLTTKAVPGMVRETETASWPQVSSVVLRMVNPVTDALDDVLRLTDTDNLS